MWGDRISRKICPSMRIERSRAQVQVYDEMSPWPRMDMLTLKSTHECSWHDWRAYTLAELTKGSWMLGRQRALSANSGCELKVRSMSYKLKFELQVRVMRLISSATIALDCQAYMLVLWHHTHT
jgi:hypothetical protein